jgi:hypothetical protein
VVPGGLCGRLPDGLYSKVKCARQARTLAYSMRISLGMKKAIFTAHHNACAKRKSPGLLLHRSRCH